MIKKLIALLLAAALLVTLGACKKKEPEPEREAPASAEELATTFIRAYCLKDYLTQFSLCIYDARQHWIDVKLEGQTEEQFCEEAQRQAEERGMSVSIQTLDDYFTEFHKEALVQREEWYGKFTASADITSSVKLNEEELTKLIGEVKGGTYSGYVDEAKLEKVTEGYKVNLDFTIDGEIKDYSESYYVYAVLCDGQWLVAGQSS